MEHFKAEIKQRARDLGFDLIGVAPAAPADGFDRLQTWLAQGFAGEMAYLERHAQARAHPRSILPEVKSVVMVGWNYQPTSLPTGPGQIARYALGSDYHDVLRGKLNQLLAWIQEVRPGTLGRGVVDTAPLLERDFARRAGLGWIGKNTLLLNKKLGSYLFLGALLLDLELPPDPPFEPNHCGTCTRCLDACPTDAFTGPGWLDSRRCISYLTIELRGSIPEPLRPEIGDWIFGCDVCQEVCPWNRKAPARNEPSGSEWEKVDLLDLLNLSEEEFRKRFRDTVFFRAKRRGLVRNVAIVLGNLRERRAIPSLEKLLNDDEPIVREAAAWALGKIRDAIQD